MTGLREVEFLSVKGRSPEIRCPFGCRLCYTPSVCLGWASLKAAVWRYLYGVWLTSFSQLTASEFSLWLFPLVLIMR